MCPARLVALLALEEWESGSRYAEAILDDRADRLRLSSPDRALARDVFFATIRNLSLLDTLIDRLRRGRLKTKTRNLLRIGMAQLFGSGIAPHAAVNETVELAKPHEKALANAILRAALRSRDDWLAEISQWPPAERFSHPAFLVDRWSAQHGEEAASALCAWNNTPPVNYGRIHDDGTRHETVERLRREVHEDLAGEAYPGFFRIHGAPDPGWLAEGLLYIQDPSTSLSCRLLDPRPGETVLDACAAPGGKTALLWEIMRGEGRLFATDKSERRLARVAENLARLRISGVTTAAVDWLSGPPPDGSLPLFDAILLDVPCSNTGVMRRRADVRWRLQPGDFARHAREQSALVAACRPYLKPGGRLVYSTCSIDREENERVVEETGIPVEKAVASRPWEDGFDGAYAALLRP